MADNTPINNIDFDLIKTNLRSYLEKQDAFKDYNFEGSGMSVLLDLLAYNTHYLSYYTNMTANESFLDSAVLRRSVVSLAKHLGYRPRSAVGSIINVDVIITPGTGIDSTRGVYTLDNATSGNLYIIKGDRFRTSYNGKTYYFYAEDTTQLKVEQDSIVARGVTIREGTKKTYSYTVDTVNPQRFVIPDKNVDIVTLKVKVQKGKADTTGLIDTWLLSTDILKVDGDSKVFFLQESYDETFEVSFGDGIIGKKLDNGNVVTLEYYICSGEESNGAGINDSATARSFSYVDSDVVNQVVVDVDKTTGKPIPAFGGSNKEDADSIKTLAPKNYQAQERAVTADDYTTLLLREFGEQVDSVSVWGGEQESPPVYGRVYISIKPKNALRLSTLTKLAVARRVLNERNLVTVTPEIVDPEYLYIIPALTVYYDDSKTNMTPNEIKNALRGYLTSYSENTLGKFGIDFRYSKLLSSIDSLDASFLGSAITVKIRRKFEPQLQTNRTYNIKFDNAFSHPHDGHISVLDSSGFLYSDVESGSDRVSFFDDDGYGNVRVYANVGGQKKYLNRRAGTVDYSKGEITISNINIKSVYPNTSTEISLTANPDTSDVLVRRNLLLLLEDYDVDVRRSDFRDDEVSRYGSAFGSVSSYPSTNRLTSNTSDSNTDSNGGGY